MLLTGPRPHASEVLLVNLTGDERPAVGAHDDRSAGSDGPDDPLLVLSVLHDEGIDTPAPTDDRSQVWGCSTPDEGGGTPTGAGNATWGLPLPYEHDSLPGGVVFGSRGPKRLWHRWRVDG